MTEPVVVIEKTSKRWKGMRVFGCAGMIFGLVVAGGAPGLGAVLLVMGLALYLWSRIGAWWKHG